MKAIAEIRYPDDSLPQWNFEVQSPYWRGKHHALDGFGVFDGIKCRDQTPKAVADENRLLEMLIPHNLVNEFPNRFKVILEALDMPSLAWRAAVAGQIKGIDRAPLR